MTAPQEPSTRPESEADLVERHPCPKCKAAPGSPCRSRSGAVTSAYHTGRFTKVPKLAKELRVPTPANRGPGQPWRPGKSVPAAVDPSLPSADIRIGYARCSHRTLAELATETEIAQTFTDRCVGELVTGRLTDTEAAMAKWSVTERQQQLVCRCLQLHGGYGYMTEYPIAKDFLDTRASTLFADTTEIIGKSLVR